MKRNGTDCAKPTDRGLRAYPLTAAPVGVPSRQIVVALFALTGFAALCLQVVWQRVISIHGGVDLFSSATVVAAFMAGLGLGNLLGGTLADRLGPNRSILAFAVANLGIGLFGLASIAIFYDGYRALAEHVESLPAAFAFHFVLLVIPTTLMGLSLPLLTRGLVRGVGEAAPVVSRLYAANTLGAAAGAAVGGWFLLGNLGFDGTVRFASTLNLVAAGAVLLWWRRTPRELSPRAEPASAFAAGETSARIWPWLALYAATGAAALALEVVYFRLVDGIMRSNSYTFAHVLTLYLLLFGAGAAAASERARRAERPDVKFLWIQFWIGVASLLGVLLLLNAPPLFGLRASLEQYFRGEGFIYGFESVTDLRSAMAALFAHVLAPALVMGAPVFLMGYAYPFVAALVLRRDSTLGRHTGALMACNILGNVAGSLLAGFVLLDAFGTAGTLTLLAALLMSLGVAAAVRGTPVARTRRVFSAIVAAAALLALFPSNERLWSFLHGAPPERFELVEERSCVNALVDHGDEEMLHLNAAAQNGYPYDDFHLLIGLFPALLHPAPQRALAVGLGIGATPYGMLLDPRIGEVETVEICAGLHELLTDLGERGATESQLLLEDPRLDFEAGDGRKRLLTADAPYDVITVDALRPQSGYSGNVYSVEFYELVSSRLARGGLFAQWVPTDRVLASVAQVFPYVVAGVGPGAARFIVASNEPIALDRAKSLARFRAQPHGELPQTQRASLEWYFEHAELRHVRNGEPAPPVPEDELNRDLHPRDEYFLNDD